MGVKKQETKEVKEPTKKKLVSKIGQRFGRLTVKEKTRKNGKVAWECECDCGNTTILRTGDLTSGNTKSCGCLANELTSKRNKEIKTGIPINVGENNGMWTGEEAGLMAIHAWVRARKPKPEFCECCGIEQPYDLANISQEYHRDIDDFEWLCRRCHMTKDGRLEKLKENGKRYWKMIDTSKFCWECLCCSYRVISAEKPTKCACSHPNYAINDRYIITK